MYPAILACTFWEPAASAGAASVAAPPPVQLRSGGRGQGYDNPHSHPGHIAAQELAPDEAIGERFYAPDEAEAQMGKRLAEIRKGRGKE